MRLCCGAGDSHGASSDSATASKSGSVANISVHIAEYSKQIERDQEFIKLLGKLAMSLSIAPRDAYTINLHHTNVHGGSSVRSSAAGAFVRTSHQQSGNRSNRNSMNGGDDTSVSGFYRVKSVIIPRNQAGAGPGAVGLSSPIATSPPPDHPFHPAANDPHGLMRTQSRRVLEHLIQKEDKRQASGQPSDLRESGRVQERRLASRLDRLNLDMVVQAGDGNCESIIKSCAWFPFRN